MLRVLLLDYQSPPPLHQGLEQQYGELVSQDSAGEAAEWNLSLAVVRCHAALVQVAALSCCLDGQLIHDVAMPALSMAFPAWTCLDLC